VTKAADISIMLIVAGGIMWGWEAAIGIFLWVCMLGFLWGVVDPLPKRENVITKLDMWEAYREDVFYDGDPTAPQDEHPVYNTNQYRRVK